MNHEKETLCKAASEAVQKDLVNGMPGFMSLRLMGTNHILTTPGNWALDAMGPEDLMILDLKGNIIDKPKHDPPDALEFILSAFQMRSEVNALGHFHPPRTNRFSELDDDLIISGAEDRAAIGEVLRVTCQTCTSRYAGLCRCFENRSVSYAGANALIIKDDGIVTLDRELEGVINKASLVEEFLNTI